ncbi:AAC(3) family N-acetyltransferase [Actinacidiphila glaucinigra]|uniref:Aminoglycoside N(3)-acetyltransferase n=1 Tax=Actinacidiphila glaucinigra TaxID=235986 RepID=A0A239H7C6_9ACTN|nr:AAC(3) family N-acetyltransferase [Actinacidiphila glaucinigra]SNS77287.1 aminoglycoside 3-N-acetyltransferase [Actinacidiphila glaucinigra]
MHTLESLTRALRALGIEPGEVLLVQGSLKALGPVEGGGRTVVAALRAALGDHGTLVAYAATPENSLTSRVHRQRTEGMDETELAAYREAMPAFDPLTTPVSPSVGRLAEEVRLLPGALRSAHPHTSFTAFGPAAGFVTEAHALESHLGEDSPTARLYDLRARALLIGVDLWVCTAYHLADYRAVPPPDRLYQAVVRTEDGGKKWVRFEAPDIDDRHFPGLVPVVASECAVLDGPVGDASCHLVPIADAVDAIAKWLVNNGR